jgi:hypothetical protein
MTGLGVIGHSHSIDLPVGSRLVLTHWIVRFVILKSAI